MIRSRVVRVSRHWRVGAVVALLAGIAMVLSACSAQTTPATNVGDVSAELNGIVNWSNGDGPGEFWFEYSGNNGASWAQTPHESFPKMSGCQSSSCPVTLPPHVVTGLNPSTRYLYRIAGCLYQYGCSGSSIAYYDSNGSSSNGNWSSFTTQPPVPPVGAPDANSVTLGVDDQANPTLVGNSSTQGQGLKISATRQDQSVSQVLLSVRVNQPTSSAERLRIRGEFHLSSCRGSDINGSSTLGQQTPCVNMVAGGQPDQTESRGGNSYIANVSWHLIYANSPTATSGTQITSWERDDCSLAVHRCPFTVASEPVFQTPDGTRPGYINLVAAADSGGTAVHNHDVLEVDGEDPTPQNRLSVLRLGANRAGEQIPVQQTTNLLHPQKTVLPLDDGDRVLFRETVTSAQAGNTFPNNVFVDANAQIQAQVACSADVITNPPCNELNPWPFIQSRILATQSDQSGLPDLGQDSDQGNNCANPPNGPPCRADMSAPADQLVSPNNAKNCIHLIGAQAECSSRQTGIVKIPQGSPSPTYLTLIARADKNGSGIHNYLNIDGGFLEASCESQVAGDTGCTVTPSP